MAKLYKSCYTQISATLLFIAYSYCALSYSHPPHKPYPLFPWNLYSTGSNRQGHYDIVITSLQKDVRLERPIFLADLEPDFHRDWQLSPFKLVRKFGFTMMGRDPEEKKDHVRRLLENFMVEHPYVEYDLVTMSYASEDMLAQGEPKYPDEYTKRGARIKVLRSFVKDDDHVSH